MTKKNKIISSTIGGAITLAIFTTLFVFWLGPSRQVRQAMALRDQFARSEDLTQPARNKLKTQLMRSVDEMDRDTRCKLREKLREEQRDVSRQSMADFRDAADDEKPAILDEAIDYYVTMREANSAIGRGGGRGRYRGGPRHGDRQGREGQRREGQGREGQGREGQGREGQGREGQGREGQGREGQRREGQGREGWRGERRGMDQPVRGERNGSPRSDVAGVRSERGGGGEAGTTRGPRRRGPDPGGDRDGASDEERQLRTEYYAALQERAEERGIAIGRRRG